MSSEIPFTRARGAGEESEYGPVRIHIVFAALVILAVVADLVPVKISHRHVFTMPIPHP